MRETVTNAAYAEGAITLSSNLLTMIGMQLREAGTSREDVPAVLTMLHETNEETVRSPRASATASRHLMAVYRVLAETWTDLSQSFGPNRLRSRSRRHGYRPLI